ncbi:MAG: hypothetical protein FalmKO_24600 [Falsiruegeria mediterranea]
MESIRIPKILVKNGMSSRNSLVGKRISAIVSGIGSFSSGADSAAEQTDLQEVACDRISRPLDLSRGFPDVKNSLTLN